MKVKTNIGIILITSFLFFSCKKEGCMDEYAKNYDVNADKENDDYCVYDYPEVEEYMPYYGENTATLTAIDKEKKEFHVHTGNMYRWDYILGAKFYGSSGYLESAGNVSMSIFPLYNNGPDFDALIKHSDNSYSEESHHDPATLGGSGTYSLPNPLEWKATGDVWPAFDLFTSIDFSKKSVIQSGIPILSSSYNFTVNPTPSADSLILEIIGQRKQLLKVIPASESSHVFNQNEVESLGKGNAILRVVSVKYDKQEEGGKTYYFLNQKRDSKKVIIE